jgi:VWFA-related protein
VGAASAVPGSAAAKGEPVLYSNRPQAVGKTLSADAPAPESTTILLLDPTSLSFADLTHAREQILKFLEKLPTAEPVALYVRTGAGFHILAEETADHAALSSALRKWMPTAPDLARAQEEERRNRQQFDYVQSPSEMPYVNGNTGGTMTQPNADPLTTVMTNAGGNTTSDPKLVREGANPAREALAALIGVAANLDAIPGHKDLVWVASDNVLAIWTDQAPGIDRGANPLGGLILRVQEALNDAHVSLYPLDASQFEGTATDASLANSSVQLNPAVSSQYPSAGAGESVTSGRATAEMRQDMHATEPAMQHLAQATGGRSFPRSGNLAGDLKSVIADGHAAYLVSFAPDTPPDDKYHRLTVTVPEQHGLTLRYRAGYLYTKEPATLKERFRQAVWQPQDETEIGLRAHWDHASEGAAVSLDIAATDIGLAQQRGRWIGKLDVFLVQRDNTGTHATVKEETLVLDLKPETYQKVLHDGIPFAEYIPQKQSGTVRIIVVDENSGRLGSVTLPTALERAKL